MSHKNFFMVSNKIFELKLKPRDFTVYCCLLQHSDEKMRCFPSRKLIATECRMDKKTVDSAIESLSALGLVKKVCRHRENGTRTSRQTPKTTAENAFLPALKIFLFHPLYILAFL